MRGQSDWSIGFGTWFGVKVRLHLLVLLFAAMALYLGWYAQHQGQIADAMLSSLVTFLIVAFSVVAHECVQAFTVNHLGGSVDSVLFMPWGGITRVRIRDGWQRMACFASGIGLHLLIVLFTGVAIATHPTMTFQWGQLLDPFAPHIVDDGQWATGILKLTFWVNWILFCVNLIPAYPFDGVIVLRHGIWARWPMLPSRQVDRIASIGAIASAAMVCLLAVVWRQNEVQLVPTWYGFVVLAVVLVFASRIPASALEPLEEIGPAPGDLESMTVADYPWLEFDDIDELDLELQAEEEEDEESISLWLQQRRKDRERQRQEIEIEEEHRADDILAKVHRAGMDSLSDEERQLLNRLSARLRKKSQSKEA